MIIRWRTVLSLTFMAAAGFMSDPYPSFARPQAQQQEQPKKKRICPLCPCAMAYDDCDKVCATKMATGKICKMQCIDICMHQKGGVYCPRKPKA